MSKVSRRIERWPLYVLGMVFLLPVCLVGYVYYEMQQPVPERKLTAEEELTAALVRSVFPDGESTSDSTESVNGGGAEAEAWQKIYPKTVPMTIGEVTVSASVAASWPERIKGLSGTPFLPPEVVKFFDFDTSALHSIWMKDMNYSIDILWLDESGRIVSIVKQATPESYPETFSPSEPSRYVVETVAGFVDIHEIKVGDVATLPAGL